jgi:WD40 repeat protein
MMVVPAPRGSLLAVVRSDQRVDIFDGASGALVRTLSHPRNVTRAAFSPDARYVATGSWDRRVRIWAVSSNGGPIAELARDGVINNVAFISATRVALISAAPDFSIWSWETKDPPHPWKLRSTSVHLAATEDVAAVAVGGELFVFEYGSVRRYYSGVAVPTAIAVARSFDDTQVAVGGEDGTVAIQHRHFSPTVLKHPAPVKSIDFSTDGQRVLVAAGDSAHVWNNFAPRHLLKMAQPEITFAQFSHDGRHIVTAGANGSVTIWSDRPRFTPRSIKVDGRIARLHFFSNGSLAVIVQDPKVRFHADESVVIASTQPMPAVKLPPHQTLAFAGDRMAFAHLRDVTLLDERLRRAGTVRFPFDVQELAFSHEGLLIAAAGDAYNAAVHDTETGRTVNFEPLATSASSIVFAGPHAVAVSQRDGVALFDRAGRRRDVAEDPFAAMEIASTRNGELMAIASADSITRIRTKRLDFRAELPHRALVHDLAFNADGTRLVTAADDGFIRIWDTAEAREVARLERQGDLATVALSSDDRWLAFEKAPGRIEIWPWRPADLREEVCRSVSRRFTTEESRHYFDDAEQQPCRDAARQRKPLRD